MAGEINKKTIVLICLRLVCLEGEGTIKAEIWSFRELFNCRTYFIIYWQADRVIVLR